METLDDLFRRLEQLNDIGASLSNERDLDRLLEKILLAAKAITRADGGTLYLVSEDQQRLHFQIVRTDSLSICRGDPGRSEHRVSRFAPCCEHCCATCSRYDGAERSILGPPRVVSPVMA